MVTGLCWTARGKRGLLSRACKRTSYPCPSITHENAVTGTLLRQIGIIGVGMIGASVAAAVRSREITTRIVAYSPGEDAKIALAAGWIDHVCEQATDCLEGSDLVVLSAPVSSIMHLMPLIAQCLAQQASEGKPLTSAAAANPDLFVNRMVLLCQGDDIAVESFNVVSRFWQSLGARTATIHAKLHDEVYAEVSHWPHAAAFALCLGIARGPLAEHSVARAGAGLKDTTRIAASDPALWTDILLSNKAATLASAQRHRQALSDLIERIEQDDRAALVELLTKASQWRQGLQDLA
ncbi:MAG: prephenate dehydrogenase/arogenate dehydrogenase family protein [Betaproteobacteria bacterium]|nr:prephenate dehydrogenase/arogenate dehydrogenase family protein [Betaproteobacteria bacterium]